jgi:hypothetical protein
MVALPAAEKCIFNTDLPVQATTTALSVAHRPLIDASLHDRHHLTVVGAPMTVRPHHSATVAEQIAALTGMMRSLSTSEKLHRRVAADQRSAGMIAGVRLM